ncbi:MAG: hypothetical protein ACYC7L_13280 [Nitrospirota bacterium]
MHAPGGRAANGRLSARNVDEREIRQITVHSRYGPLLYPAAAAAPFVPVGLSVGLSLCLAVFFAVKGWPTLRPVRQLFSSFPRRLRDGKPR